MAYHVVTERTAIRTLDRLRRGDRTSAKRIAEAIKSLADDPRPQNARQLVGREGWRLRAGDYRVIYVISDEMQLVTVTRIGHRGDVYER